MEKLVLENQYKIVVPLFGAAFAAPNKVSKGAKIRNRYNQVPHLT